MIGVLGGWGSGKSTVVSLVSKSLSESQPDPKISCFIYDAWLHQSDPPRRAFLEALLSFLEARGSFADLTSNIETWRVRLKEFDGETRKTQTTVTPTLTGAGRWYVLSLLLVPLGLKLMGSGVISPELPFSLSALAGWLLSLSPLIAAAVIYLSWRPWSSPLRSAFWLKHRAPYEDQSILSIVANKQVERKDELAVKSAEPTAIEFQNIFREIVEAAQQRSRKLMIIIDNLDRLPPGEAISLWATVRSFFLGADGGADRPSRDCLPTVIVPVDEKAFSRMYSGAGNSAPDATLSRSFIEKTFDLVFQVPAPVLSRWHAYLETRLKTAFGSSMPSEWAYIIGSVYEYWLGQTHERPTPRSMNAFVNKIAVTYLQFADEKLSVGVIAYYVLQTESIAVDIHEAVRGENKVLDGIDPEWRVSLAALHYGVSLSDALEVFMDEPITTCIKNNDGEEFTKLLSIPGFNRYFLAVLDKVHETTRLPVLYAASLLRLIPDQDQPWIKEAQGRLRLAAIELIGLIIQTSPEFSGLTALISSTDGAERLTFLRRLAKAMGSIDREVLEEENRDSFIAVAEIIVRESRREGVLDQEIPVPGGAVEFANLLLRDASDEVVSALVPESTSFQHVIDTVGGSLNSEIAYGNVVVLEKIAVRDIEELDWTTVLNRVQDLLSADNPAGVRHASATLIALYKRVPSTRERVASLHATGILERAFRVAWAHDDEGVAQVISLFFIVNGSVSSPDGRSWADKLVDAADLPTATSNSLIKMGQPATIGGLANRAQAYPAEVPLLKALGAMVLSGSDDLDLEPEQILSAPEKYLAVIPAELVPLFWQKVAALKGFWARTEVLGHEEAASIYAAIFNSSANKSQLGKFLQKRMASLTESEWHSMVRAGVQPYGLVQVVNNLDRSEVRFGPSARAALNSLLPDLLQTSDSGLRERWFLVASRLSDPSRKTLMRVLADKVLSGSATSNVANLLETAGTGLLKILSENPDAAVLHLLLPLISEPSGSTWALVHVSEVIVWFAEATEEARVTLIEQLDRVAQLGDTQAGELRRAILA